MFLASAAAPAATPASERTERPRRGTSALLLPLGGGSEKGDKNGASCLRLQAGHKRALWTPATLAPFSLAVGRPPSLGRMQARLLLLSLFRRLILSHLRPVGEGNSAAYTPAARRRAGRLRSVYVGEREHGFWGNYLFDVYLFFPLPKMSE